MRLCIPVNENDGVNSTVCAHFGSAPLFVLIDTNTMEIKAITNGDQHHAHGLCQPLKALNGEKFDGVVVGGIGKGALMKLRAASIDVYRTSKKTVQDTVHAFKRNELELMSPGDACSHHENAHNCKHD